MRFLLFDIQEDVMLGVWRGFNRRRALTLLAILAAGCQADGTPTPDADGARNPEAAPPATANGPCDVPSGIPAPISAETRAIPDAPANPDCRVTAQVLLTMGSAQGPGALGESVTSVREDGLGRFWVSEYGFPPLIFDAQGEFLRPLGTQGAGPGEYVGGSYNYSLPGDSSLVFDRGNRRAVIVGPDLSAVRYVVPSFPLNPAVVLEWPTRVLIHNPAPVSFLLVDFSGVSTTAVRTFEDPGWRPTSENPYPAYVIGASTLGRAWAAEGMNYELVRWDASFEETARWARESPFFLYDEHVTPLSGIREDEQGKVWTHATTWSSEAVERWRQGLARLFPQGTPSGFFEVGAADMPSLDGLTFSAVEVLDVERNALLARTTLEYQLINLLPGNRAAAYVLDELTIPRVQILQLRLEGG